MLFYFISIYFYFTFSFLLLSQTTQTTCIHNQQQQTHCLLFVKRLCINANYWKLKIEIIHCVYCQWRAKANSLFCISMHTFKQLCMIGSFEATEISFNSYDFAQVLELEVCSV